MAIAGGMTVDGGKRLDLTARLEEWRRLLLDTSKRSRLISSKFGRGGVLGIDRPEFYQLWEQLAVANQTTEFPWPSRWIGDDQEAEIDDEPRSVKGTLSAIQLQIIKEVIALNSNWLLTNLTDKSLDGRLKRLATAAATSLSEQGVNTLFLAFGFLRWFESADSDVAILSPLVLMPVTLRKQSADSSWELSAVDDDLAPNHPLTELLRSGSHLNLPQFVEEELWESSESLRSFFAEVGRVIADHERWEVQLTAGLGTFAFQKIAMWQDLSKNADQITGHVLCRGIAGDPSRIPTTDTSDILGSDADLDQTIPPESSYLIRDCDSSQLAAMELVRRGHHLILDGPPGTGKSQTITNIIACCLAANKTVLFVSEKAAALEIVKRRLDEAKLGDFCLECHSHKANKRTVVEELGRCLNRQPETYPSQDHQITELRRTRQKLNDYVRALHVKRSALDLTAYGVHGRLAKIRTSSATRVAVANPHSVDRNRLQEMEEAVIRLASCGAIIAAKAIHPWRGCHTELYSLTLPDDIRFHFDRAAVGLAKLLEAARPLESLGFLRPSPTRNDLAGAVEAATTVLSYPRIPPVWVEAGLQQTAERYLALHELSKNHRILWSSIPAYASDAYVKANPSAAATTIAGASKLRVWFPALPLQLREQAAFLTGTDAHFQRIIDLAVKLDAALRLLRQAMGLPESFAPTVEDANGLATNAVSIAGLGQATPQWFDAAERDRLRQISAEARRISSIAVPKHVQLRSKFVAIAFAPGAEAQSDAVNRHQTGEGLARLGNWVRALPTLLRSQASHLAEIYARLQTIANLTAALESSARLLTQAGSLPDTLLSNSRNGDEVAASILAIVALGRVKSAWFDTTERKRLRLAATDAKHAAAMALATRSSLEAKFSPTAFAPIARQQIEDLFRYRWWIKRLGRSWQTAKRSFCTLYSVVAPKRVREIFDDAFQLKRFHDYVGDVEKSMEKDRATLLWDGELSFDWNSVIARLEAIENLPGDFQSGETARLIVNSLDSAARPTILSTAQQIRDTFSQLSTAANQATEVITIHAAFEHADICALPLAQLAARSRELGELCQKQIAHLTAVFPFIASDQDVDLADMRKLKDLHKYIGELAAAVAHDRELLQWDGSLGFDWDALIGRLDVIDLLPTDVQDCESVRALASSHDSTPRKAVVAAAERVRELCDQILETVAEATEVAKNQEVFGVANGGELSPAVLMARASEIKGAYQDHVANLKSLFPLIESERDVAVDGLVGDFEVLNELRNLTDKAGGITSALGEMLPDPRSRSLGDWKDDADLAVWVIEFLKRYHGTPPEHLVRAIADDNVRASLSAALEDIKRADDPSLRNGIAFVESVFSQSEEISTSIVLNRLAVGELIEWLAMRVRDADRISEWVGYINASEEIRRVGLETLRDEILDGRVRVDEAVGVLRRRFYSLWLDEAYRGETALGEFDLAQHDQTVGKFREVDRFCVTNGFARVRSKILDHTCGLAGSDGQAPERSELGILLREVNKKKRHLPLRRLFAAIPTLLPKLKPCLMMSPLAVSTYFGDSNIRFDVVIFDEASQVRPHDAICAIYRGRQLVVAGDQKQLPPTSFFERLGSDDAGEDEELEHISSDYESILDMCTTLGLPRQRLKWHYRSRRESLIAFSNWHYYGGELITFPSVRDVDGSSGVAFSYVENGRWAGGAAGGLNQVEAEQIADAVIRHASEQPDKSLGVITMNMAQQELISDLIDARRRESLHLEDFFSDNNSDKFFIKNLETVQGDERDVIFLGVGYAKDDAGKLSHNFGPLNRQGGERRLNVAITRARESLTIFTSIRADDIDLSRTQSRGAKLLKAYIDFAEHGRKALASAETENSERDFDSDFEAEVARALTDQGLEVRRQIGCSGFRIDLALVHPEHPGRFVLGVECDGATYHSSATARDRDRLRQDVLENLGWKLCRIWSTDWVRDPRRQIQKMLDAYQRNLTIDGSACSSKNEVEELIPTKGVNRTVQQRQQTLPQFSTIDDVPIAILNQAIIDAIKSYGAMPLEDLMQSVARKLGFHRTGSRIRDRLSGVVKNLERQGKLVAKQNGDTKSYELYTPNVPY